MDQQRTIWTVITAAAVVILVVVSAMAYQSTQHSSNVATDVAIDYEPYRALTFDLNLPALTTARYALWAVDDSGQYVLLKEFMVNDSLFITDLTGRPLSTSVSTAGYDLHQAASFVVSIEPGDDTPTTPSSTVVLQTNQRSGASYRLEFPYDITGSTGSYIIATPTNGPSTQETSGAWFAAPASLSLPTLPDGWLYAAWLKHDQTWLPMGAFSTVASADDRAQFSGPRVGYDTPGEDFLTNARPNDPAFPLDLTDGLSELVITLQPDNIGSKEDRSLYLLPLLRSPIQPTAISNTAYSLEPVDAVPNGIIRIITK